MAPLLLLALLAAPPAPPVRVPLPAVTPTAPTYRPRPPWCTGTYADDFSALSQSALALANRADAQFTYCVRTTAVYECLSYDSDGSVKRTRLQAVAHGTAFAYRRQGADTLLLTNQHVAEYPQVTDDDHPVPGIPSGCKRVSDALRIVDNDQDSYAADDIPLTRVVSDPAMDISVLKTRAPLSIMPWKVGQSAALQDRNVVEVRGFPLGVFKATVQGRVTSTYDHDDFGDWDHDDFVVDAQLSTGNSGSPVLAVSCATGEYELVGVFHADYSRGKSLNVVVQIDQLRGLMSTLKRTTPVHDLPPLNVQTRRRISDTADELGRLYFPLGPLTASVQSGEGGTLFYALFSRDFPQSSWPELVLEDLDTPGAGFGALGRLWFGNARGLAQVRAETLAEPDRVAVERGLEALRQGALLAALRHDATAHAATSRQANQELARLDRDQQRATTTARDLAGTLLDLADRSAPPTGVAAIPPGRPFLHAAAAPAGMPPAAEGARHELPARQEPQADGGQPAPR